MTSRLADTMFAMLMIAMSSSVNARKARERRLMRVGFTAIVMASKTMLTEATSHWGRFATRDASVASRTMATTIAMLTGIRDSPAVTRLHAGSTTVSSTLWTTLMLGSRSRSIQRTLSGGGSGVSPSGPGASGVTTAP